MQIRFTPATVTQLNGCIITPALNFIFGIFMFSHLCRDNAESIFRLFKQPDSIKLVLRLRFHMTISIGSVFPSQFLIYYLHKMIPDSYNITWYRNFELLDNRIKMCIKFSLSYIFFCAFLFRFTKRVHEMRHMKY